MASSVDFVEFVCEQLAGTGAVRHRKMFGEYMVYVDDRPLVLVCDDTAFVRIIPELAELMAEAGRGFPYEGAKEHYILDIDDAALSRDVVGVLLPLVSVPKARKKA